MLQPEKSDRKAALNLL